MNTDVIIAATRRYLEGEFREVEVDYLAKSTLDYILLHLVITVRCSGTSRVIYRTTIQ